MRTLGQLLTAIGADALPSAEGIIIYESSSGLKGPPGWGFVAVYGNAVHVAITANEKGTLEDAGAKFDETKLYP